MKYPIFALFGIVLAAGCFDPQVKNGGFACTGTQDGQCPSGYFCVNNLCVDNPNTVINPGGGAQADLSQSVVDDMATSKPPGKGDMAKPIVADMAKPIVVADMTMIPPDMTQVSTCAHDKCTTGVKLKSGCDPCVTSVCQGDKVCCSNKWDSICVSEIADFCTASQQCP